MSFLTSLRRFTAASLLIAAAGPATPALADTPVEDAVKAWVAAIDATPGWQASYTNLAADPTTGAATLSGLSVKSLAPGFSLAVGSLKIDGFHASSDPVFIADEIDIGEASVTFGEVTIAVPSAVIAAPALPETGGFAWDSANVPVSTIHALAALTTAAAASIKAPTLAITGPDIDAQYASLSLIGWRNGKIAASSAGPLKSASPAKDPLVTMSASAAQTRDIDLNALVTVLDPARYANGSGDNLWRPVIDHSEYRDLAMSLFGVNLTAAGADTDGFRLRQSKIAPTYRIAASGPTVGQGAEAFRQLEELPGIGADRVALNRIDGAIAKVADAHLDTLTIANVDGGHIGDFALTGLSLKLADKLGSVALAKFGIGGLVLPSPASVQQLAAERAAGTPVDYASLVPPLTYVEATGLDIAFPDTINASLGHLRVDLGDYDGQVPKTLGLDVAAADLPAWTIPSDHARALLARFGYERLHVDASAHTDATIPGQIAVKDFRFAMKDAGALSGSANLSGTMPSAGGDLSQALADLALKDGNLTVTDDSVVGRLIAAQAMRLKVDPEKFRQQFATGLPLMLMFLNNRDLMTKLTPALQGFIRNGGSLTAVARPPSPVALSEIAKAATTAPFTLFTLLSAEVSGIPGAQPTVIPTLPVIAAEPAASPPAPPDTEADQPDDNGDGNAAPATSPDTAAAGSGN